MICFDRIKRKSLSYPVWYAKLLQAKRAWSASGCPGRPGLSDSQIRPGGVAEHRRNVRIRGRRVKKQNPRCGPPGWEQ